MSINHFTYDSDDELYFAHWLAELADAGLVDSWTRNVPPFILTNGLTHYYTKETILKTKRKLEVKSQRLLRSSEYTPDFKIIWNTKGQDTLYQTLYGNDKKITAPFIAQATDEGMVSIVEIKPDFDFQNKESHFVVNQKYVWDKHAVFVNLIHISDLFGDTFTPAERLFKKNGQPRRISKWEARNINQYLNQINYDKK